MIARRFTSRSFWLPALAALLTLVMGTSMSFISTVDAANVCSDPTHRGVAAAFQACGAGEVCAPTAANGECLTFAISIPNPRIDAYSHGNRVFSNADISHNIAAATCFGTTAVCGTPSSAPTQWVSRGSIVSGTEITDAIRPGRSYTEQYAGTFVGVTSIVGQTYISPPGYKPASVSVSNILSNQVTVNWTTDTPGSSQVFYSSTPPSWRSETNSVPTTNGFYKMMSLPTGLAVATSATSTIYRHTASGWLAGQNIDPLGRTIYGIDGSSEANIWAVGASNRPGIDPAFVARSTDAGVSWTTVSAGITSDLYTVSVADQNTAWASGFGQKVYQYNGTAWVNKTPSQANPLEAIRSILAVSATEVWAAGSDGRMFHTTNGGGSWTVTTPPGATGLPLNDIASLNGTTVWVAGSDGSLWRSTNGGQTFPTIIPGGANNIRAIIAVRPDEVYFISGQQIGHIASGTTSVTYEDLSAISSYSFDTIAIPTPTTTIISNGHETIIYGLTGTSASQTPGLSTTHSVTVSPVPQPPQTWYFAAESWDDSTPSVGTGILGQFTLAPADTTPPTIVITNPAGSQPDYINQAGNPYQLAGTMQDNLSLVSVRCSDLTSGTGPFDAVTTPGLPLIGANVSGTWTSSFTLGPVERDYHFQCTVSDSSLTATRDAHVIYDNTPPALSFSPRVSDDMARSTAINALPYTVDGTVSDANPIDHLEYQLNGGPSVRFDPPTLPSTSWNFTLTNLQPNDNTLVVRAFDVAGNITTDIGGILNYQAPTFTITATPSADRTATIGTTLTYTVNVVPANTYSRTVSFSANTVGGMTTTFSPATSGPPYGPVTMTVNTTAGVPNPTPVVPYNLVVTGSDGTITANATLRITLTSAPSYTLSASNNGSMPNLVAGQTGSYTIALSANDTMNQAVTLSVSGLPTGASARFFQGVTETNPYNLTPNQRILDGLLEITTTTATPAGSYNLVLRGQSPSIADKTFPLQLNITAAPDFTFTMTPGFQTVTAGGSRTFYDGTVTSANNFTGLVDLSIDGGVPNPNIGVLLEPLAGPVSPGNPQSMRLWAWADSPTSCGPSYPCTFQIRVKASYGTTVEHTVPVDLIVEEDVTAPVIRNITVTAKTTQATFNWDTNEVSDSTVVINGVGGIDSGLPCVGTPPTCHHTLVYPNLTPNTTYTFSVTSHDFAPARNAGTKTTFDDGSPLTFTTPDIDDIIPPTLVVTDPLDSVTPIDMIGSVSLSGTAADNRGVAEVRMTATLLAGGKTFTDSRTCTSNPCDFTFLWTTDPSYPNGLYDVVFIAQDTSGVESVPVARHFNIINDWNPPQILDGPTATIADTCTTGGPCWAEIRWITSSLATSEVWYDILPTCSASSPSCTYSNGPVYDQAAASNSNYLTTTHVVRLNNLVPREIYHYQIRTCNGNRLCAY